MVAFVVALTSCAAPGPAPEPTQLLYERPDRPHEVIARVQVRGRPGTHVAYVYDDLRHEAGALGADAVVRTAQRRHTDATPLPDKPEKRPELGRAYPGPLDAFEPGHFPVHGFDLQTSGPYYVVEGLAIRYLE